MSDYKKTALVLGAGGFIGSHMVKRLREEGYWVRGVDIKEHEFCELPADDFVVGDLCDPRVVEAVVDALLTHELVKIRVGQNSPTDRREVAAELAAKTDSEVAQVLGSTILLYRRHPEEPQIRLPS